MATRTLAERYVLGEILEENGSAVVYRATDLELRRAVAVKLLISRPPGEAGTADHLRREVRAASTLAHPNIAAVYDVGLEDDTPFLVTEHVEGTDLEDLLRPGTPLRPVLVASLGAQLASALDHAHANGLVHRRLTPRSITVTPDDRVKVTDFGAGSLLGASTQDGPVAGDARYVSPEEARGETASPISDVYSAGVILYQMATGHLPFRADDPVAVARMHAEVPAPRASLLNPGIPRELEAIVMRALAKDPARRFQSAGELGLALSEYENEARECVQVGAIPAPVPVETPDQAAGALDLAEAARHVPWGWAAFAIVALFAVVTWASILGSPSRAPGGNAASPNDSEVAGARATPAAAIPPVGTPTGTPSPAASASPAATATPVESPPASPTATVTRVPAQTLTPTVSPAGQTAEESTPAQGTGNAQPPPASSAPARAPTEAPAVPATALPTWAAPPVAPTLAPATPVPATPVPATPVPATPVPATPIPATPVPVVPTATATPEPPPPAETVVTPETDSVEEPDDEKDKEASPKEKPSPPSPRAKVNRA